MWVIVSIGHPIKAVGSIKSLELVSWFNVILTIELQPLNAFAPIELLDAYLTKLIHLAKAFTGTGVLAGIVNDDKLVQFQNI